MATLPVVAEPVACMEHRCNGPCCDIHEVPLLMEDVTRLERATGWERERFMDAVDGWWLLRGAGEVSGSCVFKGQVSSATYQGPGCTVHAARPAACRTYPFVLDEADKVVADLHCEHPSAFVPSAAIERGVRGLDARLAMEHEMRIRMGKADP